MFSLLADKLEGKSGMCVYPQCPAVPWNEATMHVSRDRMFLPMLKTKPWQRAILDMYSQIGQSFQRWLSRVIFYNNWESQSWNSLIFNSKYIHSWVFERYIKLKRFNNDHCTCPRSNSRCRHLVWRSMVRNCQCWTLFGKGLGTWDAGFQVMPSVVFPTK